MRRWWVAEDEARWDTRSHKDGEPRRRTPGGKPYMPWHDSTMILAGPVGEALADLGNERWQRATKKPLRDLRGVGEDRKSVVSGKSVSVRVDPGGRRSIKKKKHTPIN